MANNFQQENIILNNETIIFIIFFLILLILTTFFGKLRFFFSIPFFFPRIHCTTTDVYRSRRHRRNDFRFRDFVLK